MTCIVESGTSFSSTACSHILVNHVIFNDCRRAISASNFAECTIFKSSFIKCTISDNGGAMLLTGINLNISNAVFDECQSSGVGGAVYSTTTMATLHGMSTFQCTAGTAVQYFKFSQNSILQNSNFTHCTASANTAAFRLLPCGNSRADVWSVILSQTANACGNVGFGDSHYMSQITDNLFNVNCLAVISNTFTGKSYPFVGVIACDGHAAVFQNMIVLDNPTPLFSARMVSILIAHCYFDCSKSDLGATVNVHSNAYRVQTTPIEYCVDHSSQFAHYSVRKRIFIFFCLFDVFV